MASVVVFFTTPLGWGGLATFTLLSTIAAARQIYRLATYTEEVGGGGECAAGLCTGGECGEKAGSEQVVAPESGEDVV